MRLTPKSRREITALSFESFSGGQYGMDRYYLTVRCPLAGIAGVPPAQGTKSPSAINGFLYFLQRSPLMIFPGIASIARRRQDNPRRL